MMHIVAAVELMSAVFVGVSLISQFSDHNKQKSTGALRLCSVLVLISLCIDAAAYTLNGPQYPRAFLWLINFLAYTISGIVFLSFIRYCRLYITERTELKRWVMLIPTVVTVFNELVIAYFFLTKKIFVFENGVAVDLGGIPVFCQLLNIIMLIYVPVAAFTKRKALGAKAVSLLGMYGFAPIIAIIIVLQTGLDFTVALGAVAVVIVASLLQKDEAQKHISKMNSELERSNAALRQVTEEQEAQLEEITALNHQLEENQTRLEESAAEQESQYEEISVLNKQLEAKQHYTDALYHKLMKVQACGIVAYTIPQHQVLVMNDTARKMYGIPLEVELDNEKLIHRISQARYDLGEATREKLRSMKKPGDQHTFSFWIDQADGGELHIYTTTQLVQMDNGDLVVVSSLQDITEITEMERSAARANAANSAKTSFLFNMSHDIRTPMNAIIGYSELMEKNLGNPEKTKDYLAKIKSSSDFLLSLINNVLEMSRIESGKAVLDEEILSTGVVVNEVKSVYEELMREKNITFSESDNLHTPYVFGDKVKLNEIFLNLVSNAYKYTPEGGSVSIHMGELPCEKEGWTILQTVVSDTGIGMSREYLPNLFEEFTRERNATDAGIQGTGLGMPIVKKLVDLMGGTITVESELGKGTTFVVTIPHRIANAPEEYTEQSVEYNTDILNGKHILLAEDNDLNAEIAMEILTDVGLIVDRAEDGIICVDMLAKAAPGTYDLILMDVQMPNMDGYKATEKIRRLSDAEKAGIPIIAMTANAFEEDKQNALAAGMNGHLAKPINIPALMKTLTGILKTQDEFASAEKKAKEELPAFVKKIILDMQCSHTVASLPGGLFVYEAKQPERLIYANRMACAIWGCDSFEELDTLARGSFKGLVHPDDYEHTEQDIWSQIGKGNRDLDQVKYRIIRKDGTVSHVDDFGRLIRDEVNGDVFYVFVAESAGGELEPSRHERTCSQAVR